MKRVVLLKVKTFAKFLLMSFLLLSFSQLNAQQYTVTVITDPDDGSWGTVTGDGSFASGSTVTLVAHPVSGYHILYWMDEMGNFYDGDSYTFTITGDCTFFAIFEQDVTRYNLTATIVPAGADTSCSVTGLGSKLEGETPTVEAVVAAGGPYTFDYWELGGASVATTRSYHLAPMSSDVNLIAHFRYIPQERTISVASSNDANGTVSMTYGGNTGTSFTMMERESLTLTATPANSDVTFVKWVKNGVDVSTVNPYTFNLPDGSGNDTYTAIFVSSDTSSP